MGRSEIGSERGRGFSPPERLPGHGNRGTEIGNRDAEVGNRGSSEGRGVSAVVREACEHWPDGMAR